MKIRYWILLILALAGLTDAGYLTLEHFKLIILPCPAHAPIWIDCGAVLRSKYAVMFGVPMAVWGMLNYGLMLFWLVWATYGKKRWARYIVLGQSAVGIVMSGYFVYLQLSIIHAICLYCMLSALISTFLFVCSEIIFATERKRLIIRVGGWVYAYILKPIFFQIDPEIIHTTMTKSGELMGFFPGIREMMRIMVKLNLPILHQKLLGIEFDAPVGLAAGFDYEARLTQILEPLGFGFQSIGTITNTKCEGNEKPRLGRLPKSLSLMVNKGFRNPGASKIVQKLAGKEFRIPLGISVGRTNVKYEMTEKEVIEDIVAAFKTLEDAQLKNTYFELNISCPNLYGRVSFYPPKALNRLLIEVDKLKLTKPLFIKMPINETDKEVLNMLEVISKHSPQGIIFGNLQKDRKNPHLDPDEVSKWKVGNFSGRPTFDRSNELIALSYKKYKKRFVIVGCGGVFSADDAFLKIKKGASLVQLITGMIYNGPQLISGINLGLSDLLEKEGVKNIREAVGTET
jgi:dihydroorotate dehydrogenase subfamily 2